MQVRTIFIIKLYYIILYFCNGKLPSSTKSRTAFGLWICKFVKPFQHSILYCLILQNHPAPSSCITCSTDHHQKNKPVFFDKLQGHSFQSQLDEDAWAHHIAWASRPHGIHLSRGRGTGAGDKVCCRLNIPSLLMLHMQSPWGCRKLSTVAVITLHWMLPSCLVPKPQVKLHTQRCS